MKTIYKKLLFLVLLFPFSLFAQTVEGVVVDSKTNQPMPGVNVVVKGTSNGVSTDFDGKFKLAKIKNGDVLVFSFIGYTSESVQYSGQKSLSVSMQESDNQLQEVVVQVGYGTVKKKDATGSSTVIAAKDFNKGTNVTTENLLQGRVAGVTINTSGAPGSGSEIRIRGGSSLFAKNDPLIVIDGLPIENSTTTGSTSFLASLNPSTIESITVLKDASATAIYGSRASNGVVLITTKKGGKNLAVDYNFQYGSGNLVDKIDVFSADQYRNIIQQYRPQDVSKLGTANTDWQDEIYRRTDFVDQNLSLRGNLFKVIPSRLTIGNTYQEGLRLTNKFNRSTVGLAMNPSFFNNHLKFRLNANYANEKNRFADGVEGSALAFDPTQPVYDPSSIYGGFFEYYDPSTGELTPQTPRNPVAQLLQTYDTGKSDRFFGNFELDYKLHFFPDLRAVVNVGFDETTGERTRFAGRDVATSGANNNIPYGTNEFTEEYRKNKLLDFYLNYTKTFNKLAVDATAGYSYQKWDTYKFLTGNINDPNLPTGPTGFPRTEVGYDTVLIGFFGRTNFTYNDKYLLTLTYRRDGSSKFDEDNRWANFPAAAFAWKMNQDFFKDSKLITDLKLRLGWGITGQQDVTNNNDYLQQYSIGSGSSQYFFGTVAYPIAVSARQSNNLKWEETTTYNLGLDFGIANRVNGSIEAFYKESNDLLADVATADGSNFSNRSWQNIGSFTTKGVEFTLNTDVIKKERMNWNVNFNATAYQREITKLSADFIRVGDNVVGTGTQAQVHYVGFVPNSFLLYKQLYDSNGRPIEGAFADLNGDNVINAEDKYVYRNPDPKLTLGFSSNFNYKNFDFFFNLRSSIGNRVFNVVNASRAQYNLLTTGGTIGNIPTSVLDTGIVNQNSNNVLSDMYVENASFLRMDNLTMGYTFPKWLEGKASLRLSTGVQNVFVVTKYSGLDPEVTGGFGNTIYPRQRTFLFGANVKF